MQEHIDAYEHTWHLPVTSVLFLPPHCLLSLFLCCRSPVSEQRWLSSMCELSVKLGHVTEPPPSSRLCLDTSEEPLVLYSASQPQQRSGDKHWGQGGVGTPRVAIWAGTWALLNSFQLCLYYILSGASMWSSRASELWAATTANQFLMHANWWFVTCKHKEKTERRAQKPDEYLAEVQRESQLTQWSRETTTNTSGKKILPFFFFFSFCISGVRIDHWLQSSTSNKVMDMVI